MRPARRRPDPSCLHRHPCRIAPAATPRPSRSHSAKPRENTSREEHPQHIPPWIPAGRIGRTFPASRSAAGWASSQGKSASELTSAERVERERYITLGIDCLLQTKAAGYNNAFTLEVEPDLDALRHDKRFQDLLASFPALSPRRNHERRGRQLSRRVRESVSSVMVLCWK